MPKLKLLNLIFNLKFTNCSSSEIQEASPQSEVEADTERAAITELPDKDLKHLL